MSRSVHASMRTLALLLMVACTKQPEPSGSLPAPLATPSAPGSTAPAVALTNDAGLPAEHAELRELLQRTLDLPALDGFWHADRSERKPLHVLATPAVPAGLPLEKLGAPVVWVTLSQTTKQPLAYFEVTDVTRTATTVRIDFRYRVEGVIGHATFAREGKGFRLVEQSVAER